MPSYLSLIKWTEQGVQDIKNLPQRIDAARQTIEAAGGRMIFYYMLLGEYDVASLAELPDDESAARVLLTIGGRGNVRTTSMKAFTEQETRDIVASLP